MNDYTGKKQVVQFNLMQLTLFRYRAVNLKLNRPSVQKDTNEKKIYDKHLISQDINGSS